MINVCSTLTWAVTICYVSIKVLLMESIPVRPQSICTEPQAICCLASVLILTTGYLLTKKLF